jgi:hypothetical protein
MVFVFSATAQNPYLTQMHIHGWSNHNGAEQPGSLQFHNKQADSTHVNVLWWTEHHNIFHNLTQPLNFDGAVVDPVTLNISGIAATGSGDYQRWNCLKKEGISLATVNNDTLQLKITSINNNNQFESLSYTPASLAGLIKDVAFVKPLATLPLLNFSIKPVQLNNVDTKIRIVVKLSWHYRQQKGQDILVYELSTGFTNASLTSNNNDSVFAQLPLTGNLQNLSLNIEQTAALLDHGIDNTISEIELQILARKNKINEVHFSEFNLIQQQTKADSIVSKEREILDYYTSIGKTHNLLGVEYSKTPHLNGYIPKSVQNADLFMGKNFGDVTNWIDLVHQNGGLVSYNHMFGTNWLADSESTQDYRADTLADYIFNNAAYGADILEVGYMRRGGADLKRHLRVWDRLTAKGLFLYGNGVSDSHGDEWMQNSAIFHTWIYANDSSDASLLALSTGKLCFGIHSLFQGNLWYSIDNLQLGERGFANKKIAKLNLTLSGAPAGSKIKLTQILLSDSPTLQYIYNEVQVSLFNLPNLNLSKPCLLRIGVYDANDTPLIFGQPIVILGVINDTTTIEFPSANNLIVFPNPVSDKIYFQFDVALEGIYQIRLIDELSRVVAKIDDRFFYKGNFGFNYDATHLRKGIYFLEILSSNNKIVKKVMLE